MGASSRTKKRRDSFCDGEMRWVKVGDFSEIRPKMYLILNRTEKSRKKPVETKEIWLTKRSERMKVNCGTVLRTRMNIDDFALKNLMRFTEYLCR